MCIRNIKILMTTLIYSILSNKIIFVQTWHIHKTKWSAAIIFKAPLWNTKKVIQKLKLSYIWVYICLIFTFAMQQKFHLEMYYVSFHLGIQSNPNSYSAEPQDRYMCTGCGVHLGVISLVGGCSDSHKLLLESLNWWLC